MRAAAEPTSNPIDIAATVSQTVVQAPRNKYGLRRKSQKLLQLQFKAADLSFRTHGV
jgi:hypothetical protein